MTKIQTRDEFEKYLDAYGGACGDEARNDEWSDDKDDERTTLLVACDAIVTQRDAAVAACYGLLAGTDGYWETLPEGVAAILAAQAVIAGEPSEG